MNRTKTILLTGAALVACLSTSRADDPNGLFFKPIPPKTVVLTFDDGPLSHYTYVAPLLKSLGLPGTFFWTEAWLGDTNYMNWAQVSNICAMGFEVGNHTKSHSELIGGLGGGRGELTALENDCLANGIAKPSTIAYPIYVVNPALYPMFYELGYFFGRTGNELPYHPTVDSPFYVPSYTINDSVTNDFYNACAQAVAGQAVVFTFHGVPDIEHPTISTDPTNFAPMMQYLKANNYNVIAMRDLGKYVGRIVASVANTPVADCTATSAVLHTTFNCAGLTNTVYAYWNSVNGGTNAALWTNSALVGTWTNAGPAKFAFAGGTNFAEAGTWTNMAATNLSCAATGLAPNTTYYYTFRASNDWGNVWATNVLSFRLGAPTVENGSGAINLAAGLMQLRGTVSNGVADVYLYWGATDGGANPGNWANTNVVSNVNPGAFAANINLNNPLYGAAYYYRCYASNSYGTAWARAAASFTTMKPVAAPPAVGNYSFETPVLATGTRQARPSGATWTMSGGNEVGIDAGSGTWWYPMYVPDGRQAAYLFGYGQAVSVAQSLSFAKGGSYTVSFDAIGREGYGASPLNVRIDGADVLVLTADQFPQYNWQSYTTSVFTVSAGAHTLTFINTNLTESGATSIDDVQVGGAGVLITLTNAAATGYSGPSATTAVLNATLGCTGSVYNVYAYWDTTDGGTNAALWANSAYVGSWTNVASTSLSYTVTGLSTNTRYFFTFRATNAADDLWATNVLTFGPSGAKDILSFGLPGLTNAAIAGTNITWSLPSGLNVTALAPTYTVSPLATGSPSPGMSRDFTTPQTYTITAEDGSAKAYAVAVTFQPLLIDNALGANNLVTGVAQLRGALSNWSADVYIYWGTADGGAAKATWGNVSRLAAVPVGAFSGNVSNLLYGVVYYYRSYGSNQYSTAWAPATASFTAMKPVTPAPVVANYSFETPALAPGGFQYSPSGATWSFVNAGIDNNGGPWYVPNAPDGVQGGFIQSLGGSISQPITFASAGNYTVNFQLVGRSGYGSRDLSVQIDGATVYSRTAAQISTTSWTSNTTSVFTVTAGTHTLAFVTGAGGDSDVIDNVQFVGVGGPDDLTNAPATGVGSSSATLNARLACTGAVYSVVACWNTVNGGTNAALWANSAYVGSWTNVAATNLSYTATGLAPSTPYYFTFRATNVVDSLWATNVQSFVTLAAAPTPVLPVSGVRVTNGVPSFSFAAAAGCRYRLDYKDALTDAAWLQGPWATNATGGAVPMTLTDPGTAGHPQRFYRLEAANL